MLLTDLPSDACCLDEIGMGYLEKSIHTAAYNAIYERFVNLVKSSTKTNTTAQNSLTLARL